MIQMTTITANGGAVRFWRNFATGERAVLCCNGRILLLSARPYARWKRSTRDQAELARDPRWRADTTDAATRSITRTNRDSRRA